MAWRSTGVAETTLKPRSPIEVMVDGRPVLLVRLEQSVYASDAYCPHEGGILSDGQVSEDHIVCPVHGAQFDLRTGAIEADPDGIRPPTGSVSGLASYPVKVVNGIVHVEVA